MVSNHLGHTKPALPQRTVPAVALQQSLRGLCQVEAIDIGIEYARAADQRRHVWRSQCQQLGLIDQQLRCCAFETLAGVIAKAVRGRFQNRERLHAGLILRSVHAPRGERHCDVNARSLGGGLDRCAATEQDQVGLRNFLAARCRFLKPLLDHLQNA